MQFQIIDDTLVREAIKRSPPSVFDAASPPGDAIVPRARHSRRALAELVADISDFYIRMWGITRGPAPDKPVVWCDSSLQDLRRFNDLARRAAARQLRRLQEGKEPLHWKPLATVGTGVIEIRVHASGEQRVIVVSRFAEAVYVLHAFEKKSRKTSRRDNDLARRRYRELMAKREQR